MEAIRSLHQQLDDDDNGNIDLSESDDVSMPFCANATLFPLHQFRHFIRFKEVFTANFNSRKYLKLRMCRTCVTYSQEMDVGLGCGRGLVRRTSVEESLPSF